MGVVRKSVKVLLASKGTCSGAIFRHASAFAALLRILHVRNGQGMPARISKQHAFSSASNWEVRMNEGALIGVPEAEGFNDKQGCMA